MIKNILYGGNNQQQEPKKEGFFSRQLLALKNFRSSDLAYFMDKYIVFIIYYFVVFYVSLSITSVTRLSTVYLEMNIFTYICIIYVLYIVGDILNQPFENSKEFIGLIIFSLIIVYGSTYLIIYYYKGDHRFILAISIAIIISLIFVLIFYIIYYSRSKDKALRLFNSFSCSYIDNNSFLRNMCNIAILLKIIYTFLNMNNKMTDMLLPAIMAFILLIFVFRFIITICLKLKIINRYQILNSIISLGSILLFLLFVYLNFFLSGITDICKDPNYKPDNNPRETQNMLLLIFVSILIILWLVDARKWSQSNSILFVFASIVTFYSFFIYSMSNPGVGFISLWAIIEWFILYSTRTENSKNSIHFSFMNW